MCEDSGQSPNRRDLLGFAFPWQLFHNISVGEVVDGVKALQADPKLALFYAPPPPLHEPPCLRDLINLTQANPGVPCV